MDNNFKGLVDQVAGPALLMLVRGEKWTSIVGFIANEALMWKAEKDKEPRHD